MQELSNTATVTSVNPVAESATAGLFQEVSSPVIGIGLVVAVTGVLLLAAIFRSRRMQRRRLQIALTAYAERQLLRDRPVRAASVMSRSV